MERTGPTGRSLLTPSQLGGVPAAVARAERRPGQIPLALAVAEPARERLEPMTGAVHVRAWLGCDAQRDLVRQFRAWALPPAGLRQPRVPTGHLMSVRSVCLGWHWQPYVYSKTADDTDRAPVKPLPRDLRDLARRAVAEAFGAESAVAASYAPDAAIVNFYEPGARLGLHRDWEEPADAPVVTLSIGDTCIFRFAGVDRRTGPFTDVELASGDLLVFGGPIRRIYHGVPKVIDGSAPRDMGLPSGRLSITIRETGFDRASDR